MSKKLSTQFLCSSMMLPEHVSALNKLQGEEEKRELAYYPEPDEQQLELWDSLLKSSKHGGKKLKIEYNTGNGPAVITGVVSDFNHKAIRVDTSKWDKTISLESIVNIEGP